jgi:uncharacterized FlaG/YvyC family protein
MKIDPSIPTLDASFPTSSNSVQIQSENRQIIQAVRAVNASASLGDSNELTFSLDQRTRRPIVKIVNRETNEVVEQIPNERVLRLAEDLKLID